MKQKLITLFFALVAGAGTLFAQSGACGDNLTWTLNDGTLTISGTGDMYDYWVYDMQFPWYNYRLTIKKGIINSGVTNIGNYAFFDCSILTSVTIPNSVTSIGDYAFSGCSSLTSVTIPNSVTSIGRNAFDRCIYLNSVTMGNSVNSIGNAAFTWCSSLKSITIPNGVETIGDSTFYNGNLTSVTIPNSVTSIGNYAFGRCHNMTSVTIPNSVTKIGDNAFEYCESLTSVTIPNSVTKIGSYAFAFCYRLTYITIPNGVLTIGSGTFYGCSKLISVTIPNSVTSIGHNAFSDCSSLISLTIPNSVTKIGDNAFHKCSSLTSVTIGNSVTSIGVYAFDECSNLTSVICYAMNPPTHSYLNYLSFGGISQDAILYVLANALDAYIAKDIWKNAFKEILPLGATSGTTDGSKIRTVPTANAVEITWPMLEGASRYELTIYRSPGNFTVSFFVFNAKGQVTSVNAAPARDRSNIAAVAQDAGLVFTVTGLEPSTTYGFKLQTKDNGGTSIGTRTGMFTTLAPTALEDIMDDASSASSSSVRKVLHNGQLYILRDGKVYNAVGAEVQ